MPNEHQRARISACVHFHDSLVSLHINILDLLGNVGCLFLFDFRRIFRLKLFRLLFRLTLLLVLLLQRFLRLLLGLHTVGGVLVQVNLFFGNLLDHGFPLFLWSGVDLLFLFFCLLKFDGLSVEFVNFEDHLLGLRTGHIVRENEDLLLLVGQATLPRRIGHISLLVVHDEESRRFAFGGQ